MADPNQPPGWTVERLRKALQGLPGSMTITVRGQSDDGDFCGGIMGASAECAHDEDDTEFFAIDCSDTPEDFEDYEAPPQLTLVKP